MGERGPGPRGEVPDSQNEEGATFPISLPSIGVYAMGPAFFSALVVGSQGCVIEIQCES